MKKEYKNIEDLFKESFHGYKIEPTEDVWKKINYKLNLKDFFSSDFKTFNIYYLSVITGIVIIITVLSLNTPPAIIQKALKIEKHFRIENKSITQENNIETKISVKKKKELISYPTEIYTRKDFKNAIKNQHSELVPLVLKNNLKEFSEIYGDSINNIESIKVEPPKPLFSLKSKIGCVPFEITLKNQTQRAQYYEWIFGDGSKSTQMNPSHTYLNPGHYTIKLKAIGTGGIAYSIIDSVIVNDGPKNKTNWPYQSSLVEGERIILINETQNAVKYEWDFGDGTFSTLKKPDHIFQSKGKYLICLKSWTDKNCMDSSRVAEVEVLKVESLIAFPTAFSPNSDGPTSGKYSERDIYNDIFHPVVKGELMEYHLKIYSREGSLIFESDDLNTGWDGYYHKQRVSEGVYPFIATGKFDGGKAFVKKGNVTVIYGQK